MSSSVHAVEAGARTARQRLLRRGSVLVTVLYSGLLLYATHHPKPDKLIGRPIPSDKLMHFVAYGGLGMLVGWSLHLHGRRGLRTACGWLAALALAAVFDEATQPLFGRHAEPLDWTFDVIGLAAGLAAAGVSSWALAPGSRRA